jgi:hypothetical protein
MRKIIGISSLILVVLSFQSGVKAQIYETVDEEGNPVFSDTPSPEAKEVELPSQNIADAPPPSKRPTGDSPESQPEEDAQQRKTSKHQVEGEEDGEVEEDDEVVIIYRDDSDKDRIDRERIKNVKDRQPEKAPKPSTLPARR